MCLNASLMEPVCRYPTVSFTISFISPAMRRASSARRAIASRAFTLPTLDRLDRLALVNRSAFTPESISDFLVLICRICTPTDDAGRLTRNAASLFV